MHEPAATGDPRHEDPGGTHREEIAGVPEGVPTSHVPEGVPTSHVPEGETSTKNHALTKRRAAATSCSHPGNCVTGKNVPENKKSGTMPKR